MTVLLYIRAAKDTEYSPCNHSPTVPACFAAERSPFRQAAAVQSQPEVAELNSSHSLTSR